MTFDACPSCGYNREASWLSGSHFCIFECTKCERQYCHSGEGACRDANRGTRCPDSSCRSTSSRRAGTVYLR